MEIMIKNKSSEVVAESAKTRKAREKLQRKFEAIEKMITPEALEQKTYEIHRWIERHSSQRTVLKSKEISLFDENQNAADVSKKVSEIADQIRKEYFVPVNERTQDSRKILQSMVNFSNSSAEK
jgi:hypothetical protein